MSLFAIRATLKPNIFTITLNLFRNITHRPPQPPPLRPLPLSLNFDVASIRNNVRCMATKPSNDNKNNMGSRFDDVRQLIQHAEERAASSGNEPIPKITIDHVTVSFARSGGPGGQNVNKVSTKVDMRFNVNNAHWLSDRVKEKILQMEKNRINKDGEIVMSSTKTRTQKGNIQDALEKLQEIINAASYVPPPPSQEKKKKIAALAAEGERRRLQDKKSLSQKKSLRRSRNDYD